MVRVGGWNSERGFGVGLGCFCLSGGLLEGLRGDLFLVICPRCLVLCCESRLVLAVGLDGEIVLVNLCLKIGIEVNGVQVSGCG